ncbi:hypothetical protein [Roseibium sp.]|uniref:hypothetical protein n=1 Tax=Roseibium sp. TaxID=1936156 RepID=UPI003A97AFE5
MSPISTKYSLGPEDFDAYKLCSSLFARHLADLSQSRPNLATRIRTAALKAALLALLFVVAVYVLVQWLEEGHSLDLLSPSTLRVLLLILGTCALIVGETALRRRADLKKLFDLFAAESFSVRLEPSGFALKLKRMQASFEWEPGSCKVLGWKDYIFILHQNTMVVIPARALPGSMSTTLAAIAEWQSATRRPGAPT